MRASPTWPAAEAVRPSIDKTIDSGLVDGVWLNSGRLTKIELGDRLARQIRRSDRFGLALHRFWIERRRQIGGGLVRPGVIALLIFKENLGDAGIARRQQDDDGDREPRRPRASGG